MKRPNNFLIAALIATSVTFCSGVSQLDQRKKEKIKKKEQKQYETMLKKVTSRKPFTSQHFGIIKRLQANETYTFFKDLEREYSSVIELTQTNFRLLMQSLKLKVVPYKKQMWLLETYKNFTQRLFGRDNVFIRVKNEFYNEEPDQKFEPGVYRKKIQQTKDNAIKIHQLAVKEMLFQAKMAVQEEINKVLSREDKKRKQSKTVQRLEMEREFLTESINLKDYKRCLNNIKAAIVRYKKLTRKYKHESRDMAKEKAAFEQQRKMYYPDRLVELINDSAPKADVSVVKNDKLAGSNPLVSLAKPDNAKV